VQNYLRSGKKYIIILFLLLVTLITQGQILEPQCSNIIGQALNQPSGGTSCIPVPLNPAIPTAGTPVTRCFSYQFIGPINLGYLLVTGQCGPFPLYNTLSFSLYNLACDTLIMAGPIYPFSPNNDTYIDELTLGEWYIICYHWVANCPQTDACPIIYTSLLPVSLLDFDVLLNKNEVLITWSTASQLNTSSFRVMKSKDYIRWEVVDEVEAAGYSNHTLAYIIEDNYPSQGSTYYRLLEEDYDGNSIILAEDILKLEAGTEEPAPVYYNIMGQQVSEIGEGLHIYIQGNKRKLIYK
jgi:hypothetical protein